MRENKRKQRLFLMCIICLSCMFVSAFFGVETYASSGKITNLKDCKIPVLMYHHLVEFGDASGVTVTADKFNTDMEYLYDSGYTPLLPNDLLKIKMNEMKIPKKPIMITFDDGYQSNYKIAYPILKEMNMKATIFVIAKNMNRNVPWQVPKLTWDQMKEMYESGVVDIQSHTYNLHNSESNGKHLNLAANGIQRGLIESRAQYEHRFDIDTKLSIELIEKNVGNKVICIAYPYGAYEPWCTKVLADNGIQFGFMVENQLSNLNGNSYHLKRYNIEMSSNLLELLEHKEETEIY